VTVEGEEFAAGLGSHADERIVESVQDQRGHGNVLYPVGTGNAAVIVVRTGEAAISRHHLLVELPHGANRIEPVGGVETRIEIDFVPVAL